MTATRRGIAGLAAAAAIVATLSACTSSSTTGWSELIREAAETDDALPPSIEASESLQDIDPSSVRFQWESEGVAYYSALSASAADTGCLIMVEDETAESACGQNPPLVYDDENGTFALGSFAPQHEGWEKLTSVLWRKS